MEDEDIGNQFHKSGLEIEMNDLLSDMKLDEHEGNSILKRIRNENKINHGIFTKINLIWTGLLVWDILLNFISIWQLLFIPYFISFRPQYVLGLKIANSIFDIMYIIEIVIQFLHASYQDRHFESDIDESRRNYNKRKYLLSYFAFDLLAAVPFNLIDLSIGSQTMRWFRLFRIVRIIHLSKFIERIEFSEKLLFDNSFIVLGRLLFFLFIILHNFTCVWYYFALHLGFDKSWALNQNMEARSLFSRYVTTLYFTSTTLATVGYGDIYAVRTGERIFVICMQIFSIIYVAYVTAQIVNIITQLQHKRNSRKDFLDMIKKYIKFRNFPREFSKYLLSHSNYVFDKEYSSDFDEKKLFLGFPPIIRKTIINHIRDTTLKSWKVLKEIPDDLVEELFLSMERRTHEKGDKIVKEDDTAKELFVLDDGIAMAIKRGQKDGFIMKTGSLIGESSIYSQTEKRKATVYAVTRCTLLVLKRKVFINLLKKKSFAKYENTFHEFAESQIKNYNK